MQMLILALLLSYLLCILRGVALALRLCFVTLVVRLIVPAAQGSLEDSVSWPKGKAE